MPRGKISREGYPRLAAGPSGNVFLAYRTSAGDIWGPLGTCWFEHLARFDGEKWEGPVYVGRSDGILDQRPALAPVGDGKLLNSPARHRRRVVPANRAPEQETSATTNEVGVVLHRLEEPGFVRLYARRST